MHLLSGYAEAIEKALRMSIKQGGSKEREEEEEYDGDNDNVTNANNHNSHNDEEKKKDNDNALNIIQPVQSLQSYIIQKEPSNVSVFKNTGFEATRISDKYFNKNIDYGYAKSDHIIYSSNINTKENEEMKNPTKKWSSWQQCRLANNLSNSQELIIFQSDAKNYFQNLVLMKGGVNKLNKLEQKLIKLTQCRNTHLQWEVMFTFYNNLTKPIFMRLKDSNKIKSVVQSKQLVKEIDIYIMALTKNPESLIQGCILPIYDADDYVTLDQIMLRVVSSTYIAKYLNEEDRESIVEACRKWAKELPAEDQARFQVLHEEADEYSMNVATNMTLLSLQQLKILHDRRTEHLNKNGTIGGMSDDELESKFNQVNLDNDVCESAVGGYKQVKTVAPNSTHHTAAIKTAAKQNNVIEEAREWNHHPELRKRGREMLKEQQEERKKMQYDRKERWVNELKQKQEKEAKKAKQIQDYQDQVNEMKDMNKINQQLLKYSKNKTNRIKYIKSLLNNYKNHPHYYKLIKEK